MKKLLTALTLALFLVSPVISEAGGLEPLNSVPVPLPANLGDFVVNIPAAVQLGKAFFWDMQTGGDGVQACASCHYQAGADVRIKNTANPGIDNIFRLARPGRTLNPAKFPVRTNDIVGSQGVKNGNFLGLSGTPVDNFLSVPDPVFNRNGINTRRVTGRNAPSAINAVFYYRNFWDGRANNIFNGVDPSGPANTEATVFELINGVPTSVAVSIPDASLASQSVGPPNSAIEMAFAGRTFPQLGRKLLNLKPLGKQVVDPTDSVLGPTADVPTGLATTYPAMIQAAFDQKWWDFVGPVTSDFTMMEANFSLFWGLSIMLYESTLVSDQTPLDQFLLGDPTALTPNQQLGMEVYEGKGRCDKCHGGAELTEAVGGLLNGFLNTAVRPRGNDGGDIFQPGQGKFKTPALRNVELNGPYMHNGGFATLRQTVDFYDRGGDFPGIFTDSDIRQLRLTEAEKVALVDFMLAMTDERVRFERAPFDHPSLRLPNAPGGLSLPAVGAAGRATPLVPFLGLDPFAP